METDTGPGLGTEAAQLGSCVHVRCVGALDLPRSLNIPSPLEPAPRYKQLPKVGKAGLVLPVRVLVQVGKQLSVQT